MNIPKFATAGRTRLTKTGQISGLKESLNLTGDVELQNILKNLPDNIYRKVIARASRKAVGPVLRSARNKAPRETGLLRKSLGIKVKQYKRAGVTVALVGPRKGFKELVKVYMHGGKANNVYRNPVSYAHLVEFGTRAHSLTADAENRITSGSKEDVRQYMLAITTPKKHPGAKAQPFLRPAYDENRARMIEIMHSTIGIAVVAEAKRLGK